MGTTVHYSKSKQMHRKDKLKLPDYLKALRLKAGLTQWEVSEILGYATSQFVSNWEKGRSSPPLDALARVIQIYKANPAEVVEIVMADSRLVIETELNQSLKMKRKTGR